MSQSRIRHQDSSAKTDSHRTWTQDPHFNKGTAFTKAERDTSTFMPYFPLRLRHWASKSSVLWRYSESSDQSRQYTFLRQLQENSTLFWALSQAHTEEVLPIIYTPTVGHAIAAQCSWDPQNGIVIRRSDLPRLSEIFAPYQDRELRSGHHRWLSHLGTGRPRRRWTGNLWW